MSFVTNGMGMNNRRQMPPIDGFAPMPPAFRPQIVRSVRMRPRLAAGVAAAVLVLLLGYALTRRPVYLAESQVHVEPAAPKMMSDGVSGGAFDSNRYESYLQQQILVVTRPDVLAAAIASLPAPAWHQLGPTPQAAATSLAAQLRVSRVTTSYELSISLQGADAAATTAIVNAVTSAYLDAVHKDATDQSDQRAQLLAEERRRIEGEMQAARQEQAGLSASLGVASPLGEAANPYDFEIASVRQQLLTAREAHDASEAQLSSLSGEDAAHNKALASAADELITGDPGLSSMRASVGSRRSALTGQMAGMKPDNPIYKQDLDELNELDKTVDGMTTQLRGKAERQLQQKLRSDLERTGDVESQLNAQLGRLTARASTAAPKLQRAAELSDDLQRLNARYATVDDSLRSLQLEANGPGVVRLSLPASVPTSPEASRKMLLILAAPLLALFFGVAAAVLARKRDRHIYSGRDIEELLGFAPMAVLPARGDVSARVLDQYVLRLAAGIEGAYRSNGAQTFLLTAVSASTDIRPLRNALTGRLERIGLDVAVARTTDLMVAELSGAEDAGQELTKPGEAAGEGFVSLHLAKLKGAHALVVIDAPALGTSAETEYVARCADATILIAECGVTTREELVQSAMLLERLNAKGIAAVLEELHLRFAETSFRQAIEAFEQRQPERSYQSEQVVAAREDVYEAEHAEAEHAEVEHAEAEPALIQAVPAPVEMQPEVAAEVKPEIADEEQVPVEVAAIGEAAEERAAPIAFRHRSFAESTVVAEIQTEPEVHVASSVSTAEPEGEARGATSREKMAPTLLGLRARTDGDTRMAASKSWFHRFLHRNDEKVTIIPDSDDEDEKVDSAAFLTSRISRAMPAYDLPMNNEHDAALVAAEESHETAFSRQFVLDPTHAQPLAAVAEETSEQATAETPVAEETLAHVQPEELESHQFVVPQEIIAPWTLKGLETHVEEAAAPEAVAAEPMVATEAEPVVRVRPHRPLTFHELAGTSEAEAAPVAAEEVSQPEAIAEETSAVASPAPDEPVVEAAPESTEPVAEPMHEVQEAVASVEHEPAAAVAEVEHVVAPVRDPYAAPGTSRWDPIPQLRPSDSGWNRLHAVGAPQPVGAEVAASEPVRKKDERTWTSRADGNQDDRAGEIDEPALSRPWGLLSRFQQAHLNTPARRPEVPGQEQGRQGAFQAGREG